MQDGKFDGEPVSEQIGLRNRPIPKHELTQYTLDGSVDVHGNPSIRAKTGGWKACPFILGKYYSLSFSDRTQFMLCL